MYIPIFGHARGNFVQISYIVAGRQAPMGRRLQECANGGLVQHQVITDSKCSKPQSKIFGSALCTLNFGQLLYKQCPKMEKECGSLTLGAM